MNVVYVKGKPFKLVLTEPEDRPANTRCDKCWFYADPSGCVDAGPSCMPDAVEVGRYGYFVPIVPAEPDEQCGVGNG